MYHKLIQRCRECNKLTNHVKFHFTDPVPDETYKRQTNRKIKIWSSRCTSCGHQDGKIFTK